MSTKYEEKFAGLLRLCDEARKNGLEVVVIAEPQALGDDYAEMVESLNRISDAQLCLSIVPRRERSPS